MTFPPVLPRVLAALSALLLLVGVIGAATIDESDDAQTVATADLTTTTTVAGDGGQGLGAPVDSPSSVPAATQPSAGAPVTTVPPRQAGTTTTKPAAATGDPGQPVSPKLGTYRYRTTSGDETKETTVKIAKDPEQAAGEDRFVVRVGEGGREQSVYTARRSDGIYVRKMTFPSPSGGSVDCDWEPDLLEMKFPLKAGAAWRAESTCNTTFNGEKATFHMVENTKVVGPQRAKIGGQEIDVWGMESTSTMTVDTTYQGRPFHLVYDTKGTSQYSARHGVNVKSDTQNTISGFGGEQKSQTQRELLSLTPQ
ncbi:MAG TPA: hypothetical protein VM030_09305 [Acidimicrobiales bacterium]|nr:hypothetical protein [Acidimicrobiales bacterium]